MIATYRPSARRVRARFASFLVMLACCSGALAADLEGEWTTNGNYVFRFERRAGALVGSVVQPSTGRVFALADIVVDGAKVSFFVVHDAAWDEEVQQNGGKAFRNTAEGTFTDTELSVHGAREGTNERAYQTVMKRVVPPGSVSKPAPLG